MLNFRLANKTDAQKITQLHTQSWRENYQFSLTPEFLNNSIVDYMSGKWKRRLNEENEKQIVIIAEKENELIGFACTYLDFDPVHGAMLDNIHVSKKYKGQGIGKKLMTHSAKKVLENGGSKMFLWVLANNIPTIKFYEKLGGKNVGSEMAEMPGGTYPRAFKIFWENLNGLMEYGC